MEDCRAKRGTTARWHGVSGANLGGDASI
jgi:hypothetical protein